MNLEDMLVNLRIERQISVVSLEWSSYIFSWTARVEKGCVQLGVKIELGTEFLLGSWRRL